MTQTAQVFLYLLKAGLWKKEVSLEQYGVIDWSEVIRLAQEQSVSGLVAAGIEKIEDVIVPQQVALAMAGEVL